MIMMILSHVALTCGSEENCDKFYHKVLGLKKVRSFVVSSDMVKKIFDLDGECKVVDYVGDNFIFEIFLSEEIETEKRFSHICLEVEDREKLIEKCTEMGVETIKLPKGEDDFYLFIKDFDGNLFEVK